MSNNDTREKKYPTFCSCQHHIPIWLKDRNAANYHYNKKSTMSGNKKRSSSSSTSSTSLVKTATTIMGPKFKMPTDCSPKLQLFFANCEMGGSTFNAKKRGPSFFKGTIETALEELSKEDRLSLIRAVQDTSVEWNELSVQMKEKFSALHNSMDDHWKDYLDRFKTQQRHNGVDGVYSMSNQELSEEIDKLQAVKEAAEEELIRREFSVKEEIWRFATKYTMKHDLDGDSRIIESTHSSEPTSLTRCDDSDNDDDDDDKPKRKRFNYGALAKALVAAKAARENKET